MGRAPTGKAEALGEADALELARGADGDLVDEDDLAGNLEGGEMLAAEVADGGLVEVDPTLRPWLDEGEFPWWYGWQQASWWRSCS